MEKNMYKKPITEISAFEADSMMQQGLVVSPGTPTNPGDAQVPGMPKRRGDIID